MIQLIVVAALLASFVATGHGQRVTAASPEEDRKRLDEEIAATKAKLADLERRRYLNPPEPKTYLHVAYFCEKTTIEFEDGTKAFAATVFNLDKYGNLRQANWILAADAFVFPEESKAVRMDWDAIKVGTRIHLYCTDLQMGLGGYGPPVLKVGIPTKVRVSEKSSPSPR
jgi:hypothetical protein